MSCSHDHDKHKNSKPVGLTADQAQVVFEDIIEGRLNEKEIEEVLLALKNKGESADEILGAARAMRKFMTPANITSEVLDVCGTGGDGLHTLNISTAVAFVLAGAGVKVAKHGNRAVSSASGSTDVLGELGINISADPAQTLEQTNFCYLNAPNYHPAMKVVAPIRAKLKTRTIFNLLGPLLNPASAKYQLVGVYSPDLLMIYAKVLRSLGSKKVWAVHGTEGLDEVSISVPTMVAELAGGAIEQFEVTPEDANLPRHKLDDIKGGDAKHNAAAIIDLLKNKKPGAYRDIILFNAAAGLIVAEKTYTFEEAIKIASESIDSGIAFSVLEKLKA